MRSRNVVLLLILVIACLVCSSSVLAIEPPGHETLVADILTGRVANPGNFNFWATWVGNDKGLQQLIIDPLWMADYVTGNMDNVQDKEQGARQEISGTGRACADGYWRGKYPSEMSGGQLQRVSIARALISNPSLLIADEPVSMIDASLRMSVVNLFKSLKKEQGVSIIYITHDLATAYYVSDRIAIMLRGQIVEIGSGEQVLDDPLHPYAQLLKASVPDPAHNFQLSSGQHSSVALGVGLDQSVYQVIFFDSSEMENIDNLDYHIDTGVID